MFNVLFSYLIRILEPTRLRKPRITAYLKVLISDIEKTYDKYISYRTLKLYDVNFTGQVMYLQKKLRDTFGCQGIIIEDGTLTLPFYLSNKEELNLPVYAGNYFKDGHSYVTGEWVVYLGYWYEYISNAHDAPPDIDSSAQQRGKYEFYISNKSEISSQNDFIIKVPSACYNIMTDNDFLKMREIIEYYKLAQKIYTIISY